MSISVDDLVASMGSNHIGQEQIDLAAFKAQMAKSLFVHTHQNQSVPYHPPQPIGAPPPARRNSLAQPCNSPVQRAPTTTFSAFQVDDEDRMDEDMVEDLLDVPVSPMMATNSTAPSSYRSPLASTHMHGVQHHLATHATESAQSLFTSTDPFYVALTQSCLASGAPSAPFFARAPAFQIDSGAGALLVDR